MQSFTRSGSCLLIVLVVLTWTSHLVQGIVHVTVNRFQDNAKVTWNVEKLVAHPGVAIAIKYRPINSKNQWLSYKSDIKTVQGSATVSRLNPHIRYTYEIAVYEDNLLYAHKVVSQEACTNGWSWYNGNCFGYLSNQLASWQDARKSCQSYRGDLATVSNQTIMNVINNFSVKRHAWIGLRRQNGKFQWVNGVSYNYSYWDAGQPISRGRDCVALNPVNPNKGYNWITQLCSYSYAYICQAPEMASNQPNRSYTLLIIVVVSTVAVLGIIILWLAYARKYPNSVSGQGLAKCQAMCGNMCRKSPDYGNSTVKITRLDDEAA
ncbi:uncharacterized protein TRIADDRAFT_56924 [Trichoplax adhaerens]|uniref:C-type lectin domain-containing protein n=1 Tax=Trichoplax adhaerens TaxID=10228 RepID=B3RWY1_TRIAD|nr:hypothetical protein TRIADDRAFT_56924 [Trichoplax adhaerens]EDV24774.1 hypothetical protein TRIADDRAFT_56924 [Trichoplax adhaerens]|eukprot:XP_002112664.1 hypothetical protein TRIADDRAFT_56924 [Trichoplax adhaerens]